MQQMSSDKRIETLKQSLDLNEFLVWVGRPKPWAWTWFTPMAMFQGVFIGAIVGFIVIKGGLLEWDEGVGIERILFPFLFLTPFIIAALACFLMPLWTRIWSAGLIYAVTNKRAIHKGWMCTQAWRSSDLAVKLKFTPPAELPKVLKMLFAWLAGTPHPLSACVRFTHLSEADALAAESALAQLTR